MFSMSRSTKNFPQLKLDNFGKKKLTNVAFVIADPFYKRIWAGVPPLM
jgi:hypothetical protein